MIIVATEDETYTVDGDLSMTLENLRAILEADTSIPAAEQELYCNGKQLQGDQAALDAMGVKSDDLLMLQRKRGHGSSSHQPSATASGPQPAPSSSSNTQSGALASHEQEAEALRQEMLQNVPLMEQLRATRPELAQAIESEPARFIELLRAERQRNAAEREEAMRLIDADEFDIDAQRRIEEAIRQERVMENFGSAMEFNPESFGRVTMLYVDTHVNGHPIKAFVDSGAQATIMSPECAERCGIMRLIDRRFAGIARGVGTAKILGRVHSAQIKLGDELYLPCSFTIMEGRTTDLLFGLDMLKRHACVIDLAKNALVVHDRTIRFLDEHELPPAARGEGLDEEDEAGQQAQHGDPAGQHAVDAANANAAAATAGAGQSFPGHGNTLGSTSASNSSSIDPSAARSAQQPLSQSQIQSQQPTTKAWPANSLQALKDLGATDAQAKALLDAAGGNVEVAASLLFQQ